MNPAVWVLALGPSVLGQGEFGITVEAAAPDAFCPAVDAARDAVRARVGKIDVPDGGSWKLLYTLVHSPGRAQGDTIRLELRDPSGLLKLERELPIAGESCGTLAQIIALVIERYFRELSSAARPTVPAAPAPLVPERSPPPEAERVPSGAITVEADPVPPRAPYPGRSESHPLVAGVFAGASTVTRSAGVGLDLRLGLGAVARFRASLLVPLRPRQETLGEGTVFLAEYPLRLGVTAQLEKGLWELELGPELLLAIEQGRAENLRDATRGWRVVPGIGLRAGALYWFSPRLGLELGVSVDAVAKDTARSFVVAEKEVLRPSVFRGAAQIGVAWSVWE
jgi:hypothetical protein